LRVALKLAYLGTLYYGFQIQPDVPTIEGELFKAFAKLGIFNDPKDANYSAAGRTDKGVHAISQVVSFESDRPGLTLPRIINSELPEGIWIWARSEVPGGFDARRDAIFREYRYFLYGKGLSLPKIRNASRMFIGTHDFANFSIKEDKKSTVRTVEKVGVRVDGDFLILDIVADSFARCMVRKIVTALNMIGAGSRNEDWLCDMLDPKRFECGIEAASAYGLMLKNVNYDGVTFIEDDYAKKRAVQSFKEQFLLHGTMFGVLQDMEYTLK